MAHQNLSGNVNVPAVAQTTQNIWKFMVGKSSVQEIAILLIIWEISDSNLETGRYGQNLESPGLELTALNK